MKKLILALMLVLPQVTFAETKIVTVPVLNVRQCPNTDCNIISKLSKGEKVNVEKIVGQWSEINHDGKTGYVISRSLRDSYMYILYWAIGILLGWGILSAIWSSIKDSYRTRCNNCNKWGAVQVIDRELLSETKVKVTKVLETKHKNHTTKREVLVPGIKSEYRVTCKCKYCGNITKHIDTVREEI